MLLNMNEPGSNKDTGLRSRRPPQLREPGGIYFVTWRLHDHHDRLLPAERSIVADELRRFHQQHYRLSIFAVMDDHVHVLAQTLGEHILGAALQCWKGSAARAINLARRASGSLWQKDNYIEVLRNVAQVQARRDYIYNNPRSRWSMAPEDYAWLEWFE
jgi:putative transposase